MKRKSRCAIPALARRQSRGARGPYAQRLIRSLTRWLTMRKHVPVPSTDRGSLRPVLPRQRVQSMRLALDSGRCVLAGRGPFQRRLSGLSDLVVGHHDSPGERSALRDYNIRASSAVTSHQALAFGARRPADGPSALRSGRFRQRASAGSGAVSQGATDVRRRRRCPTKP
jgi:hypothetical protein